MEQSVSTSLNLTVQEKIDLLYEVLQMYCCIIQRLCGKMVCRPRGRWQVPRARCGQLCDVIAEETLPRHCHLSYWYVNISNKNHALRLLLLQLNDGQFAVGGADVWPRGQTTFASTLQPYHELANLWRVWLPPEAEVTFKRGIYTR